jgi:hypothetical protein
MATIADQFTETVAATDEPTLVSFGFAGYVLLVNDGPQAVYVQLGDGAVDTNQFALASGEALSPAHRTAGAGLVCASGLTASVRILAYGVRG